MPPGPGLAQVGVYLGPSLLRMGIVVASELPRERETLLVRLMAAGPLLAHAIEDLATLPVDAHERAVAEQILLNLRVDLTMTYGDLRAVDGVSFEVADGRVLRHPRPERRRQDHDAGDHRGAAPARRAARCRLLGEPPGRATRGCCPGSASSCRRRRSSSGSPPASRSAPSPRCTASPAARADEWLERVGLDRQGRHPDREALRRPAAAAVDRLRARPRPRGGLPRRADRGARPAGPAQPVGPAALASTTPAAPSC